MSSKADGESVALQNDTPGAAGNVPIEETVSSELFAVKGMSGGVGGEEKPPAEEPKIPAPSVVKATTGGAEGEIELSWEPSAGAVSYLVLFSTESGGEFREIAETKETSITLAGLKSGVTHYFVVRANTEAGESGNSAEASAAAG